MRISIRVKLLLATCLPLVVVYLGVLVLNYYSDKNQAIRQAQDNLTEIAVGQASELDIVFDGIQTRTNEQKDNILGLEWTPADGREAIAIFKQPPKGVIAIRPSAGAMEILRILLAQSVNLKQNPALYGICVAFEPHEGTTTYAPYMFKKLLPGKKGKPGVHPASGPALPPPDAPETRPADKQTNKAIQRPIAKLEKLPEGPLQAIRDRVGEGINIVDLAEEGDYKKFDWYQAALATPQGAWSKPFLSPAAPDMLVRLSMPFGKDDKVAGVIMIEINLEFLLSRLTNKKIEDGQIMIVGKDGTFVHHPDRAHEICDKLLAIANQSGKAAWQDVMGKISQGQQGVGQVSDLDTGKPGWAVFAPIKTPGWSLLAVVKEGRIMDPVNEQLREFAAIMLTGLGLMLLFIMFMSLRITRPIGKLADIVGQVASGSLDAQVTGINSRDEIGMFAQTFNKMVVDLKHHLEKLKEETAARQAIETEMNVAREIQKSLLPRSFPPYPDRREFDIYAGIVSAKRVAGDFYDFFFIDHDTLAFIIADVSGKGVPAALYMAVTRTVIRNFARAQASPADVIRQTNALLSEDNPRSMFVTLFFGHYNTRTGKVTYCNAGHNPPYIVRPDRSVSKISDIGGMVLGAMGDQDYRQSEFTLKPGETLALYTDGVTEARSPEEVMFGNERLEALLAKLADRNIQDACKLIVQTVHNFRQKELQDDVTVFMLKRNV